jgi:hypothetical protein
VIPVGTRVIVMRHRYYAGYLGVIVAVFGSSNGAFDGSYLVRLDDAPPTRIPCPQVDVLKLPEDDADTKDAPCC